jgi:steroid delta-isomerase-like uncharacterized protein
MNQNEISSVVQRMTDAWNSRDLSLFLSCLTDDVVWDDPAMPAPAVGREAVRSFSEAILRAFPDFQYTIIQPIGIASDGNRCAVPWKITATSLGRLDPPGFAPTGRRLESEGVDLLDFRGDKVCRISTFFNVVPAAEQLLAWRLRPPAGNWKERWLVRAQRLRALWLRARAGRNQPQK